MNTTTPIIVQALETTSKSPWLKPFILQTEAEISGIKEARRNELIAEFANYAGSMEEVEDIVSQIIDDRLINAYVKTTRADGLTGHFAQMILEAEVSMVSDIIEPNRGNDAGELKHQYIFDATYSTALRGGETYVIIFDRLTIEKMIPSLAGKIISKEKMIAALVSNIVLSKMPLEQIRLVEAKLVNFGMLKKANTFLTAIAKAKRASKVESNANFVTNDEEKALHIMCDYAVLNNNGSIKIINTTKLGLTVSSLGELRILFSNQTINGLNPADIWIKSKNRKEYFGIKFDPSNSTDDEAYNLFKGFKYEPKEVIDISPFKQFVKDIICSGEELMYRIVWTFLAQMLQDPTRKMGTALVLLSAKGTGKSSFVGIVSKLIEGYFMQTADNKRLIGEFNVHLSKTLLFYANELTFLDNKRVISKLKNIITEKSFTYEIKGGATYTDENYTRIIIDSNEDAVVVQTSDERRFIYPKISEEKIGDTEYFNMLHELSNTEGFYESLMHDLMTFDYSPWEHFLKTPPKNEVTQEQMMESFTEVESWWLHCLEEARIPNAYYEVQYDGRVNIANESLYQSFVKHTRAHGGRVNLNSADFGKAFKKHALGKAIHLDIQAKITVNKERKNSNIYESLDQCRSHFIAMKKMNGIQYSGTEWELSNLSA